MSESGQIPGSPIAQEMTAAVWAWASSSSLRPKASLVTSVQDIAPMFHLMVPSSSDSDQHQHVSAMMLGHSTEQTVPVTQRQIRDYIEHVKTVSVTIPGNVKTLLRSYFLASRRMRVSFPHQALETLIRSETRLMTGFDFGFSFSGCPRLTRGCLGGQRSVWRMRWPRVIITRSARLG